MPTVAILGAGDLAAATAQALAARDRVRRVLLIDAAASVAAGKALDIQQMGAIAGFHTRLEGTDDLSRLVGVDVCVVADRFGAVSAEWVGEAGLAMLTRAAGYLSDAPIVFAGAQQSELLLAVVRDSSGEHRIAPRRAIGSAAEAFKAAVTAIVAMEARCSPGEIALSVLGAPGRFVVPWSQASIGGYALENVLSQVQLTRLDARAAKLWPPAPYTLGLAAAEVTQAILDGSRTTRNVLTVLDGEFGVRQRVGTLPVLLAPHGVAHARVPAVSTRERVLVETSLG